MWSDAKFHNRTRRALLIVGTLLMIGGVTELARVPLAYFRAANGQRRAITRPVAHIQLIQPGPAKIMSTSGSVLYPQPAAPGKQPTPGALVGQLRIPVLGLDAPVTQGTALSVLSHSAGHLQTSVLPGEVGTTVIAAHDVTYFHQIDRLHPGDSMTVQTSQGTFTYKVVQHRIVHVGTNVVNTPYPSLVLETCYPLNALTLVNRRYIVTAVLVRSRLTTVRSG